MNLPRAPIFSLLFLFLLAPPLCRAAAPVGELCSVERKASPATRANIARVLATLQSKAAANGFYAASYGNSSRVYGVAQCRQDVSAEDCRVCLRDGPPQISKLCRGKETVLLWFDYCFFRYDTTPFAGKSNEGYGLYVYSDNNVTENAAEQQRFVQEMRSLMGNVRTQAAATRGSLGLGRDQSKFTASLTIYALAQCTRDLPLPECSRCISKALGQIVEFCPYRKACRGMISGCYVRYDIDPFFYPGPRLIT